MILIEFKFIFNLQIAYFFNLRKKIFKFIYFINLKKINFKIILNKNYILKIYFKIIY